MIDESRPQQQLTHFELFPPVIKLPVSFFCSFLSSTALVVSSLKIMAGYEDDMYMEVFESAHMQIKSCLGSPWQLHLSAHPEPGTTDGRAPLGDGSKRKED